MKQENNKKKYRSFAIETFMNYKFGLSDPEVRIYYCSCLDICPMYAKFGKCAMCGIYSMHDKCPYGKIRKITLRPDNPIVTGKSHVPESEQRKINNFSRCSIDRQYSLISRIGHDDYIFISFPGLNIDKKNLYITTDDWFNMNGDSNDAFLLYDPDKKRFIRKFIIDNILSLENNQDIVINGYDMYHDINYMKRFHESFLSFMCMLNSYDKKLYDSIIDYNTEYKKKFGKLPVIGRYALLKTLKPVKELNVSSNPDEYWTWDGKYLKLHENSYSFKRLDILENNAYSEIVILPADKAIIKIVSTEQVNDKTIFVN